MAHRTRLAVVAGSVVAVGTLARLRWSARARAAGKGFVEDVMPSVLERPRAADGLDEAHAPGHRHVPLARTAADGPEPHAVAARPFAKHRHGLRHPGRG